MTLGAKERKELVSVTMDRLTGVIGASGKADELVKLTTQIVQAAKRLAEDTPEPTKTRSTGVLAEFVIAAKKIAQNVRAVDSSSLQKLSSTRKAVESLVKELDEWHEAQTPKDTAKELSLDDILAQTNHTAGRHDSRSSLDASGKGSPTEAPVTERERRLEGELRRQLEALQRKSEPQSNPEQHGHPDEIIKTAVGGLTRSTKELTDLSGQRAPSKEALLEPTVLLAKMISVLMDLVDSLFVSKFPMRTQVHSFSCMLIENTLSYNEHGRTEAAAALRLISTQVPALKSALEVMVEQCATRSQNIRESQQMSIQRNVDLHDLDRFGVRNSPRNSPAVRRKTDPPLPPGKKKVEEPQKPVEFEIVCMICTSMAVNSETDQVMSKGTDLTLKAVGNKTVLDVRKLLSKRTGLPLDHIQLRFRGDDVLLDEFPVTKGNSGPFFMFNVYEPGEEEVQDFKKKQRRKNRVKIGDDNWWIHAPSSLAVAMFDYEAFGEGEDTLEFEEGDLIEIVEKSPDGWWTGKIDGVVGDFPASFVEEISVPRTKDEAKKLFKKFKHGKLGHDPAAEVRSDVSTPVDDFSEVVEQPSHPPHLHSSASLHGHKPSPKLGGFMKRVTSSIHSHSDSSSHSDHADKKPPKMSRMSSEPAFSSMEMAKEKEKKSSKRISLLKKKKHPSGYSALPEDSLELPLDSRVPTPRSPILAPRGHTHPDLEGISESGSANPVAVPSNGMGVAVGGAMGGAPRRLSRPVSSSRNSRLSESPKSPPKAAFIQSPPTSAPPTLTSEPPPPSLPSGGGSSRRPKRPPPPPPPYSRTHGRTGMKVLLITKDDDKEEGDGSEQSVSPVPKRDDNSSPPLMMQVPTTPTVEEEKEEPHVTLEALKDEREDSEDFSPIKEASQSMEELFKDLEEFNELSSLTVPNGGLHAQNKAERDFATIPRSELPPKFDHSDDEEVITVAIQSSETVQSHDTIQSPETVVSSTTPDITVTEEEQAASTRSTPEEDRASLPAPAKPPRMRKKQKQQQQPPAASTVAEPTKTAKVPGDLPIKPVVKPTPKSAPSPVESPKKAVSSPLDSPRTMFKAPPPPSSKPPLVTKPLLPPHPAGVPVTSRPLSRPVSSGRPEPPASKPQPHPVKPTTVQNGTKDEPSKESSSSTSPKPPPRRRSKKMSERMAMYEKKDEGQTSPSVSPKPGKISPVPPAKPAVLKKTHLEALERPVCSSAPVSRTASPDDRHGMATSSRDNSTSSEFLGSSLNPNRSPVVMRRTGDIGSMGDPNFSDDDLQDCTGVGKEGVLHKEGAKSSDWKPRYFIVRENGLVYFDSKPLSKFTNPIGDIPASRMSAAVVVGKKNNFHCFAINMRYDTTAVLGCKKQADVDDWVKSINKMLRDVKSDAQAKTFAPSYHTALKCLSYLSEDRRVAESRAFIKLSAHNDKIKAWLEIVDSGEEPELDDIPDSATAVGLLKALFKKSRIGVLVEHTLAKELCEITKSGDPISVLGTKMEELPSDMRVLLKELLRVFSKVLAHTDKNQTTVEDLNHSFGPLIFERVAIAQSESLLAYLISTCEFIIS